MNNEIENEYVEGAKTKQENNLMAPLHCPAKLHALQP